MTLVPALTTKHLTLRAPRESDLDAMATFMQSPRSVMVGGPKNRHETWRGLLSMLGHWVLRGYGFWHIEETSTGKSAGNSGFINHEGWDEPELGWHVFDGFEGKGYAYEAATTIRAYGAKHLNLNGVISYIDPANSRSIALAKRLGASVERKGEVMGYAVDVYRHPKIDGAAA